MKIGTPAEPGDRAAVREQLSALVDGEVAEAEVAGACLQWRSDAGAREAWHAYQWIGDALRSGELCSAPARDAAFLESLRARLAGEAVVLAPQAPPAAAARRAWRTPAAVAAGFVAVVGVVVAMRFPPSPVAGGASLAGNAADTRPVASAAPTTAALPVAPAEARGLAADNQLIRDVRLDRYLSAHKEFAGTSALGVPSGFLRNATADAADR